MKKIVLLILVKFCMSFHVYPQPVGAGQSEIIIKRAQSNINAGFRQQILINGNNRLNLTNGSEGRIVVPDGEYTIRAALSSMTSNEIRFNVRSNSITFVVTPHSAQLLVIEQLGSIRNTGTVPANVSGTPANNNQGVERSLERAASQIADKIPARSRIAIVYVTAEDNDVAEFIASELEFFLVNRNLTVIDRSQLDRIRQEQNFHLSGDVDDDHAVSIGKIAGAGVIITGAVTGTDNLRRLRLRALDTETAQVLAVASESY